MSLPSKAIVVEPPASSAEAVTAPSLTIACASSQFVIPTLKPRRRPSTASRMIFPSADGGARVARAELRRQEVLAGRPDGLAATHDRRAAAERVGDTGREPVGLKDQAGQERCSRRRLCLQLRDLRAAREQYRAVLRDRQAAARVRRGDDAGQVGAGHRRRERLEDNLEHACDLRRRGAPGGREERGAVAARRLVQAGQGPPLAEALPVAEERDAPDAELAVGPDADARARAVGRAHQDLVLHEHPGRVAVVEVEEVAVHTRDRGRVGDVLLHRGHALGAGDRPVREDRLELVEAARARRGDHVQDDGPVRGELHLT
jgi:hypothetical protein